jgi:hypothetical protein
MSDITIVSIVVAALSATYLVARLVMTAYFRAKYEYVQHVMKDLGKDDDGPKEGKEDGD